MSQYLVLTVRFLGDRYHGRTQNGHEPEWPPSPLRLFQAIVAGAASRWHDPIIRDRDLVALEWFQGLSPPQIIAPKVTPGKAVLKYVRENLSDVAPDKRDAKFSRPMLFAGDPTVIRYWSVTYCWSISPDQNPQAKSLALCAKHCRALGWGIDMVIAHGEVTETEPTAADKETWVPAPVESSPAQLRVPRSASQANRRGTLEELRERHSHSLRRIAHDGRNPVPPLTAFAVMGYRRETDVASRPWAAFRIASVDPDDANPSFDTPRKCSHVAAWVRCATGKVCDDWADVASFVHGHDPADSSKQLKGENADRRFMYLPLPSIERRGERGEHVGAIRRVLVAAPPGCEDRVAWVRQRLSGQELMWDGRVVGLLTELRPDWVLGRYTGESRVWSTVTPVVWPGHDNGDAGKAERILRKAFVDAGLSEQLVDGIVELDWRPVGFRAGVDLASRYERPEKLSGRQYHVRVRFAHPVRGPLAVGAGRYRGLGLFAAENG